MASSAPDLTSRILRRERAIVASSIALLILLSWWFIASGAGMSAPAGMAAMRSPSFAALVVMWWLMMTAMMLPSATPAVLLYARVRQHRGGGVPIAQSWIFAAGYVAMWLAFSIVAAVLQMMIAGPAMTLRNPGFAGAFLIAAGLYQLSPLKSACLRQCRTPAAFLSRHWRPGPGGALRLGLLHGAWCVGCCWLLMALLFVGGVMNLLWVIALAVLVGIEKLVPRGDLVGRVAGAALIAWGILKIVAV